MTTIETLTDAQIRQLEHEAFAAGDALMGYTCRVALGANFTAAELNDSSCLDGKEQRMISDLDQHTARELVVAAIRNDEAQS